MDVLRAFQHERGPRETLSLESLLQNLPRCQPLGAFGTLSSNLKQPIEAFTHIVWCVVVGAAKRWTQPHLPDIAVDLRELL